MNQIGGISEFKVEKNEQLIVALPENQWFNDEIHLFCIPRMKGEVKELIFSNLHPEEWQYIWELAINVVEDKPGIIYQITKSLKELNINICKTEGVTPREEVDYSFWCLINIRNFVLNSDRKNFEKIKHDLSSAIENKFIKENMTNLVINALNPNEFLFENHWDSVRENKSNEIEDLIDYFVRPIGFDLINLRAILPISKIFSSLKIDGSEGLMYATILYDLMQSNYLLLRLFNPNQKIIYADILHKHEIGAIHNLSEIIFKSSDGHFNLLYNRAIVKKDRPTKSDESGCHWYVLLDVTGVESKINHVFNKIESCSMVSGENPVRIISYTKNLEDYIHIRFKQPKNKIDEQYGKNVKVNRLIILSIIGAVATVLWTFILFAKNDFDLEKVIKACKTDSIIFSILTGIVIVVGTYFGGLHKPIMTLIKRDSQFCKSK